MRHRFKVSPRAVWTLGFLGLLGAVNPALGGFKWFFLFFLAPIAWDLRQLLRRHVGNATHGLRSVGSSSAARCPGASHLVGLHYGLSSILSCFNPWQLRQALRQTLGEVRNRGSGTDLSRPDGFRQQVEYSLPFRGDWLVANGGVTPATSHSWDLVSQRYAYDFVVIDSEGCSHRGPGTKLGDYYAYGQPVLAAADGVVVRVRDGIRDAPAVGTGWVDWQSRDIAGNAVTIRHGAGEFSHVAHLIPGSIAVREGERVRRQQEIGRCGNSGRSTEPHLHFQVQDREDFLQAISLPVKFAGVWLTEAAHAFDGFIEGGMLVRAEPGPARIQDRAAGAPAD